MIRVVLDTNVLASGFVRPEPPPGQLLLAWRARVYALVVSEQLLDELARTFEEPYFRDRLSPAQRENNLALVRDESTITRLTAQVDRVATHPEDDMILATAVSAEADYLVTGDKKLRDVRSYRGVSIVSPREFLTILKSQSRD